MNRRHLTALFALALLVGWASSVTRASATINVIVTNDSAFDNAYELFDNVCNQALAQLSLKAHGQATLAICSTGALSDGYGSFRSRKTDSNAWNNFDLIRNGEKRSLN